MINKEQFKNKTMITDKCRQEFLKWLNEHELAPYTVIFDELPKNIQCMYIAEWLDEVSIIIDINSEYYDGYHFWWEINISQSERSDSGFETRQEALVSAIKRANKIYNK